MTRPMPGPPDWYDIDWNPTWGMVWIKNDDECDETFNHAELDKKRLTDAECAAEYWRARSDSWAYELLHLGDWFGWSDDAEVVTDPSRDEVSRWDDVAHRFATRPHALEES